MRRWAPPRYSTQNTPFPRRIKKHPSPIRPMPQSLIGILKLLKLLKSQIVIFVSMWYGFIHFNFGSGMIHTIQVSTFVRLNLEFGFLYLQWHLFGFEVPETYKCKKKPCPNIVDCFPSRPQEKTIFLYFMFLFSILCCVLNVCEFLELIWKLMKRCDCQLVYINLD